MDETSLVKVSQRGANLGKDPHPLLVLVGSPLRQRSPVDPIASDEQPARVFAVVDQLGQARMLHRGQHGQFLESLRTGGARVVQPNDDIPTAEARSHELRPARLRQRFDPFVPTGQQIHAPIVTAHLQNLEPIFQPTESERTPVAPEEQE